MKTCHDSIVAMVPLTYAHPGATFGWRARGAVAALVLPGHEGTPVPFASTAFRHASSDFTPEARITALTIDVHTIDDHTVTPDQFTNVPGRTWSPPV